MSHMSSSSNGSIQWPSSCSLTTVLGEGCCSCREERLDMGGGEAAGDGVCDADSGFKDASTSFN